jgi:hypothetical protein
MLIFWKNVVANCGGWDGGWRVVEHVKRISDDAGRCALPSVILLRCSLRKEPL